MTPGEPHLQRIRWSLHLRVDLVLILLRLCLISGGLVLVLR